MNETLKALNNFCLVDFILVTNPDLAEKSKIWLENTDELRAVLMTAGIPSDEIEANVEEYGINVYPLLDTLGFIYLPEFGFVSKPVVSEK